MLANRIAKRRGERMFEPEIDECEGAQFTAARDPLAIMTGFTTFGTVILAFRLHQKSHLDKRKPRGLNDEPARLDPVPNRVVSLVMV